MRSFIQFSEESLKQRMGREYKSGLGDCYEAAFHWILSLDENVREQAKVCHGMVNGTGVLDGKKFGHGWGELGGVVFDYSNGKKLKALKKVYYEAGKINRSEVWCYPMEKVMLQAMRKKHYGPWDMTGDTIDVPVSGPMTEELPDRRKEIGKKKVKISRRIISVIM